MKRIRVLAKVFVVACTVTALCGCDKKKEEKKAETEEEEKKDDPAGEETEEKPAEKPVALAAPAPLPKLDADAVAESFPAFVPAGPPANLAEELKKATDAMSADAWEEKNKGRELLDGIVKENEKDPHLARYLMSAGERDMISRGLRIWRQLHEHEHYLPVLVSLFGNESDRVRGDAVSGIAWDLNKEQKEHLAPYVRRLLTDPSCVVRYQAINWLMRQSRDLGVPKREIMSGIENECPVHRQKAMEGLADALGEEGPDDALIAKLMEWATESPYYFVRCGALKALGKLKVKGAEKLMASALEYPAGTTSVVYYLSDRSPYSFNLAESTIPACGVRALSDLHDKRHQGSPVEQARAWRTEMAKKRMVSKPPKKMCLGHGDCEKDVEVCLNTACVPMAKAENNFWKLELLKRCRKEPESPPWKNFTDPNAVEVGLGLHFNVDFAMRKFLREKNPEAFKKMEEKTRQADCPE